jgi:O-antigen/teichoic acid export membrane protein
MKEAEPSAAESRPRGRAFLNNVKWQLVSSDSQALLGGLVLLLMGRSMGPHNFGVFSIVMGFALVANALFEPRMQDVAAKQFWGLHDRRDDGSGHQNHFLDFVLIEVVGKLLPCLGMIILAPVLSAFANLPAQAMIFIVAAALAIYVGKLGFGLSTGLLRVAGRTDLIAFSVTAELVVRLLLMAGLAVIGQLTVLNAILVQGGASVIGTGGQWMFVRRLFPGLNPTRSGTWTLAGALSRLRENRRLMLSNLGISASDLIIKDLDVTLLAAMTNASEVGIYKMAKNIALLAWRAVDPFTLSLIPEVNRLIAVQNYLALRSLRLKSSIALLLFTTAIAVVTTAGVWLLGVRVFGAGYAPIAYLVPLMMLGPLIAAPLVWGHPLAVALVRADLAVWGSFLGMVAGLPTLLVLVPLWGIVGAGLSWPIGFACSFVFTSTTAARALARIERATRSHSGQVG